MFLLTYNFKLHLKLIHLLFFNKYKWLRPYCFIFFYKKSLFFLDSKRFRFKKIKKFRRVHFPTKTRVSFKKLFLKESILIKKNASILSLNKNFRKKSLYLNKSFKGLFSNKKYLGIKIFKKKVQKKKTIYASNKFFLKYISSERAFFMKMFNLKTKNQKATTRFTLIPHKYNPGEFKKLVEMTLVNTLIKARISLSKNYTLFLIKANLIYVNGIPIKRPYFVIKCNDIIQVIFLKSFFFFYKYTYNLILKRSRKINYCVWRIQMSKKRKNKQMIRSYPTWLESIFFFPNSIPKYLEVDFSTLSIIVLQNPISKKDFSPYLYWNFNYFFYKIMSWKWIT